MKIENFIKIYWFSFFLLFSRSLYGAYDFESRNTISYGFKLPYSIKLDCEQSLRLSGKEQSFKQTFTELTFKYEIIDDLSVIIPIRYAIFDDKVKSRITFGGVYKIGMKPIKIRFKTRYQSTHEKDKDPDELYRNKIYAHYRLNKKFEPFFTYEVFHPANSNDNSLNEYRFSLGTDFDLPRKRSLKLYYQFKVEDLNKKSPDKAHILGLTFSLN
tara:strand:- start:1044 stop:1685 length:642 start_codon:yes stop_codon:yes gene_type:complete